MRIFLMLLGAAIGCVLFSQVPTASRENMSAWLWLHVDEKGVNRTGLGHEIGPPYESLTEPGVIKPKSGYCPLDGTKGEELGKVMAATPSFDSGFEPSPAILDDMSLLRCPHCGILFTDTKPGE